MFIQNQPGDEFSAIYIHGPGLDVVERFSPGGWEDSERPNGKGVSLLVGASDPFEHLGISRGN